jgi:hypothetical protein
MSPLPTVSGSDLSSVELPCDGVEACKAGRLDVSNDPQDVGRKLCRLRPTGYVHALDGAGGVRGNLGGACLSENANAATFRFDCINNADNFFSDFVKHDNRRTVTGQVFNVWHGYENCDLALVLENRSGLHARICDLILFGIPKDWFSDLNSYNPRHHDLLFVLVPSYSGVDNFALISAAKKVACRCR